MSDLRKVNFGWASIAGADAEPVELVSIDGRAGVLTIGCQDPFWLDDEAAGIVVYDGTPLLRPENPETQDQRDAREKKYQEFVVAKRAANDWHRSNNGHGPDCKLAGCTGKYAEYRHGWRGPR